LKHAALVAILVSAGLAAEGCSRAEAPDGVTSQADEADAADETKRPFTYEDLVSLIQTKGLTSVEAVLPLLPADLRSSYVLVHDSRSVQSASYASPRAILFGMDAHLTCAFAGDPAQPGFDSLECFQFRETSRTFDFRQIRFPTSSNGLTQVAFSASNQSTDGKIQCTSCHGADPRPNWDAYSTWPGAYGADDDELGDDSVHYAAFVRTRSSDPRYRWLVQGPDATDPYMADHNGIANRPNLRFSDACGRMNAVRATRILGKKVPAWRSLAFAVTALTCNLTDAESAALRQAGIDPSHDLDLDAIWSSLGISTGEWGTQIFRDPSETDAHPWEHQGGFTYLSIDVAMTVAQDQARAGNAALAQGLDAVRAYFATKYTGPELAFYSALNALVPDPDFFGAKYRDNTGAICPALTEALVAAVQQH
jgi:hypothetical protein